jgi:hypothetical protein
MLGGKKARPTIPLGATGRLDGLELTAIGFLRRHVEKYGTKYFWSEYLLHHPRAGFLWLVESDRHWSLVRPVSTGAVAEAAGSAHFGGKKFKWFQAGEAHVDHVAGEFYWKVAAGDTTETIDYVRAPEILSKEVTFEPRDEPDAGEAGEGSQANRRRDRRTGPRRKRRRGQVREVQWSHGRYVAVEEVESAFGLSGLARPSNIAPNQPFLHRWIYKYWGLFAAAALLLGLLFFVLAPRRQVFLQRFDLTAAGKQGQAASVAFSEPFDLAARENLKVTVESDITNTWLFVEGDLVHEETNVVHSFSVLAEYYQGVEGGEAWSEGSRSASAYLSAVGPGRHTLRLEFQTGPSGGKSATTVRIEQGVPRALNFLLLLGGISFLPLVVGGFHVHFEKRRWEESDAAD